MDLHPVNILRSNGLNFEEKYGLSEDGLLGWYPVGPYKSKPRDWGVTTKWDRPIEPAPSVLVDMSGNGNDFFQAYTVYQPNELISNGRLHSDTGWTKDPSWTIPTSDYAYCDGSQVGAEDLYQPVVLELGWTYRLVYHLKERVAGTVTPFVQTASGTSDSTVGWHTHYITPTAGGTQNVGFQADATFEGKIDNVSLTKVEALRGSDVMSNGSFTTDTTGWTNSASATITRVATGGPSDGSATYGTVTVSVAGHWVSSAALTVASNKLYQISFWAKAGTITGGINFIVASAAGGAGSTDTYQDSANTWLNTDWTKVTTYATVGNGSDMYITFSGQGTATGTYHITDIEVRPVDSSALHYGSQLMTNFDNESAAATFAAQDGQLRATYAQSAAQAFGGSNSALITRNDASASLTFVHYFRDTANAIAQNGDIFYCSAWVYIPAAQNITSVTMRLYNADGLGVSCYAAPVTATNTWTKTELYCRMFNTGSNADFSLEFLCTQSVATDTEIFYIDDIFVTTCTVSGMSTARGFGLGDYMTLRTYNETGGDVIDSADSFENHWLSSGTGFAFAGFNYYTSQFEDVEVLGTELIPDPTCLTDWLDSLGVGWTHNVAGSYDCDGTQVATSFISETGLLTLGKLYKVEYTLTITAGSFYCSLKTGSAKVTRFVSGTYVEYQYCTGNTIAYFAGSSTFVGSVTNISIKEVTNPGIGQFTSSVREVGSNLLTNGGFETAGAGGADIWANWTESAGNGTIANETTIVRSGSNAAKLTYNVAGDNTYILQTFNVTAGYRYRVSWWSKAAVATKQVSRFSVRDVTNAAYVTHKTNAGTTSDQWTYTAYDFIAPTGCASIGLYLWADNDASGDISYFDDVSAYLLEVDCPYQVTIWDSAGERVMGYIGDKITDDAVTNLVTDPMTADTIAADWVTNGVLTFDTDHFEFEADDVDDVMTTAFAGVAGRLYKVQYQVKDGTAASVELQTYIYDNTTTSLGQTYDTTSSWVEVTDYLIVKNSHATCYAGIRSKDDITGTNVEVKDFTVDLVDGLDQCVHIFDAPVGGKCAWAYESATFDYDDASGYTFDICSSMSGRMVDGFTVSMWVKQEPSYLEYSKGSWLLSCSDTNLKQFYIGIHQAGRSSFYTSQDGVATPGATNTYTQFNDGNWHMATYVYEPSTRVTVYLDGVKDIEDTVGVTSDLFKTPSPLTLGGHWIASAIYSTGIKDIGDLIVYSKPLTLAEVRTLYEVDKSRYI